MIESQSPKRKILVALSGGVDSAVAAALLKESGHEVGGAIFRTWVSEQCERRNTRSCCSALGVEAAREVAAALGIPFWVFNFEKDFKKQVVDYFAQEYLKGRTPNPCIACNEHIKFRLFLDRARELGYEDMATGHYAKIACDPTTRDYSLYESADAKKDQSYFLFSLSQELLPHIFFPVGEFTKSQIRKKAKDLGLLVMNKPDSQEICFIPSNDYGAFLEREYLNCKDTGIKAPDVQPGIVRKTDGSVVGKHNGFFHFTCGQRRGLGVPYKEKLYVIRTDPRTNEVLVGTKAEVLQKSCILTNTNWFCKPGGGEVKVHVKIRAQHKKSLASVTVLGDDRTRVVFDEAQEAITPGQAAVIYDGPRILGGGWID